MKTKKEIEEEEAEVAADIIDGVRLFPEEYLEGYSDALRWVLGGERSYKEERDEILK